MNIKQETVEIVFGEQKMREMYQNPNALINNEMPNKISNCLTATTSVHVLPRH